MLNMGRRGGSFDAIRVTLLDLCKQLNTTLWYTLIAQYVAWNNLYEPSGTDYKLPDIKNKRTTWTALRGTRTALEAISSAPNALPLVTHRN